MISSNSAKLLIDELDGRRRIQMDSQADERHSRWREMANVDPGCREREADERYGASERTGERAECVYLILARKHLETNGRKLETVRSAGSRLAQKKGGGEGRTSSSRLPRSAPVLPSITNVVKNACANQLTAQLRGLVHQMKKFPEAGSTRTGRSFIRLSGAAVTSFSRTTVLLQMSQGATHLLCYSLQAIAIMVPEISRCYEKSHNKAKKRYGTRRTSLMLGGVMCVILVRGRGGQGGGAGGIACPSKSVKMAARGYGLLPSSLLHSIDLAMLVVGYTEPTLTVSAQCAHASLRKRFRNRSRKIYQQTHDLFNRDCILTTWLFGWCSMNNTCIHFILKGNRLPETEQPISTTNTCGQTKTPTPDSSVPTNKYLLSTCGQEFLGIILLGRTLGTHCLSPLEKVLFDNLKSRSGEKWTGHSLPVFSNFAPLHYLVLGHTESLLYEIPTAAEEEHCFIGNFSPSTLEKAKTHFDCRIKKRFPEIFRETNPGTRHDIKRDPRMERCWNSGVGKREHPEKTRWRCSILASITIIGSPDLDVKSRPNLFTHDLFSQTNRIPLFTARLKVTSLEQQRVLGTSPWVAAGALANWRPFAERRGPVQTRELMGSASVYTIIDTSLGTDIDEEMKRLDSDVWRGEKKQWVENARRGEGKRSLQLNKDNEQVEEKQELGWDSDPVLLRCQFPCAGGIKNTEGNKLRNIHVATPASEFLVQSSPDYEVVIAWNDQIRNIETSTSKSTSTVYELTCMRNPGSRTCAHRRSVAQKYLQELFGFHVEIIIAFGKRPDRPSVTMHKVTTRFYVAELIYLKVTWKGRIFHAGSHCGSYNSGSCTSYYVSSYKSKNGGRHRVNIGLKALRLSGKEFGVADDLIPAISAQKRKGLESPFDGSITQSSTGRALRSADGPKVVGRLMTLHSPNRSTNVWQVRVQALVG
ncbi:hypothetical protein PR048_006293 [Dryococelus australis]|uniref:Uncharacterized protein n=1 Tax=Dryococelus australis TaxID=614101 RepID=A0ABQ9ICU3_9NEOP|nr:hypothetical protein PR048_006293 [Dryococelus australis]